MRYLNQIAEDDLIDNTSYEKYLAKGKSIVLEIPAAAVSPGESLEPGEFVPEPEEVREKVYVSGVEALKRLNTLGTNVRAEELKQSISELALMIPKHEMYTAGDVKIYFIEADKISFENLLGCGTKVLDAILYQSFKDTEKKTIFEIHHIKKADIQEMSDNIVLAMNVFIGVVVNLYVRGRMAVQNVSKENQQPLPALLKNTLFGGKIVVESQLAEHLSSTSTKKFPAPALLKMDLSTLPPAYYNRAVLNPAGSRLMRYCALALKFSKRLAVGEDLMRIEHATKLIECCANRNQFEYANKCHPMNNSPLRPQKFTLRITRAVIEYLSDNGRIELRKNVIHNKIRSFTLDSNLMGIEKSDGSDGFTYPVLDNSDADFMSLTVQGLEAFFRSEISF
jgi:hypothetical protein